MGVKVHSTWTGDVASDPRMTFACLEKLADGTLFVHKPVGFGFGMKCLGYGALWP